MHNPHDHTGPAAAAGVERVAPPAPAVVVREVELGLGIDEAWALVGDADGLATWLGEEVTFEAHEGAEGAVLERDGTHRTLRVDRVETGRTVAFHWWTDDDPEGATSVTFELAPSASGTRLRVTERPAAGARACALTAPAEGRWDTSLLLLEAGALLRSRAAAGAFAVSAR